jgi:cytochrome c biogenesis protein CcdA
MNTTLILSALSFGLMTAISPCPLATNIAAISFIGRKGGEKRHILLSGCYYAAGRVVAYILLGALLVKGLLSHTELSLFLQENMNIILGPILILTGLILLGWLGAAQSVGISSQSLQKRAKDGGVIWAFPLGAVFALYFCPVSASLFFSSLLPLAVKHSSIFTLPAFFGIGTALPVLLFAIVMFFSISAAGKAFNVVTKVESWLRSSTGIIFILIGIYYCITNIYLA